MDQTLESVLDGFVQLVVETKDPEGLQDKLTFSMLADAMDDAGHADAAEYMRHMLWIRVNPNKPSGLSWSSVGFKYWEPQMDMNAGSPYGKLLPLLKAAMQRRNS